jgi:hypothetical protein
VVCGCTKTSSSSFFPRHLLPFGGLNILSFLEQQVLQQHGSTSSFVVGPNLHLFTKVIEAAL